MDTVHINLGNDSYDVVIDSGIIGRLGKEIAPLSGHGRAVIITEEAVEELYAQDLKRQLEAEKLNVQQIVLSSNEKSRSLAVVSRVCEALADFGFRQGDLLVALGGRVVGDVTGFIAATYRRGTPYVQIPTSLLAQIGSAIGGKISIDINGRKNLIGAFYQPKAVYVDPSMVRTLPTRFFHNGLGEAVKIGAVADKELFEIFEKAASDQDILRQLPEIIRRCIAIKAHYVETDPTDTGDRRILDFGHTLGGAAERYYRFNDLELTHGEATAAGMYMITTAAEILGLSKRGTAERIKYVLQSIGLPIDLDVPKDVLVSLMEHGKNVEDGKIETPLVLEIGKGYVYTGEIETLRKYIELE